MKSLKDKNVPEQAIQTLEIVKELLGSSLIGMYLYSSAVNGGLRKNSDLDILVVANQSLPVFKRKVLTDRFMQISGKVGNPDSLRPIEVTIVNHQDIVPWQYPPKKEYIYGEWLRDEYEQGKIQEPTDDPDLAIVLAKARKYNISLWGADLSNIIEPVPIADIHKAIKDSLPALIQEIKGDERNVILTFARMWQTMMTGEITPKDVAAAWAIPRLPKEHATLLDMARKAYRGEYEDKWEELEREVKALVYFMKNAIESC